MTVKMVKTAILTVLFAGIVGGMVYDTSGMFWTYLWAVVFSEGAGGVARLSNDMSEMYQRRAKTATGAASVALILVAIGWSPFVYWYF